MCDPYASYVVKPVDASGWVGKVFITNDKEGVYLSVTLSRSFLSKFTGHFLDVGRGLSLTLNKDMVTPTFIYDKDKTPATTLVLCATIKEQKVKLETKEPIYFMFVKEFVGDLSLLFSEINSSVG